MMGDMRDMGGEQEEAGADVTPHLEAVLEILTRKEGWTQENIEALKAFEGRLRELVAATQKQEAPPQREARPVPGQPMQENMRAGMTGGY